MVLHRPVELAPFLRTWPWEPRHPPSDGKFAPSTAARCTFEVVSYFGLQQGIRMTASEGSTTLAFAGSRALMSVMPINFHRYGGGSPSCDPNPGTKRIRSLKVPYSMTRVGINGRGLSYAVESSRDGVPHRTSNKLASSTTGGVATLGCASFEVLGVGTDDDP